MPQGPYLAKYGASYTLHFELYDPDGRDMTVAATFASGDIKLMKDEGTEANTSNLPTDEGTGYSIVLTATEMQAAKLKIYIIDQTATKVWLDTAAAIESYGDASAQHAFDLDTANVTLASATHTGAVVPTVTTLTNKTGFSLVSTGLDAIVSTATGMVEIAKAVWDRVLTGATHNIATSAGRRLRAIQDFQGYEGGAVWVDTVNGTAGTTDYENGTVENPVDTMADANTLVASLNISRFRIIIGSTITLTVTQNNQEFFGKGWTLALGGQDVSGCNFNGAVVSGTGTGTSDIGFDDCELGTCTLDPFHASFCGFSGTITFGKAGNYLVHDSYSNIAGSTTPIFDTGAALLNVNLSMPNWNNGIEIQNLNNAGTDLFSISGKGQIIYAASSSGAVNQRGSWKVTNTGGVTITADDNTTNVSDILVDTDELQTDDIPGKIAALNDISVTDILTTQMTEVYAADGVAPTLAQALFLIQQSIGDFSISGTTLTTKELDGVTTAATYTLDDATNPTSRTRAT